MKPSSSLLCVAACLVAVSSPGLARGPVRGPFLVFRHVPRLPVVSHDRARIAERAGFDEHRRRRFGVPFVGSGVYGAPLTDADDTPPPEALAAPPPPSAPLQPQAPPPEPPRPVPPVYVYAQIGFADFAPRIIYRHPVTRPSRPQRVVYYGIQQVDRLY